MLLAFARTGVAGDETATVKAFTEQCAMCHGADGSGRSAMGKKLKIKDWHDGKTLNSMTDADGLKVIRSGKELMPGFPELTEDQLKAMLEYVRTFQK